MKLLYITNASIPSNRAHGVQIIKSCEAFANAGLSVFLILPAKRDLIKQDPFVFYGVARNFFLKKIFSIDLIWLLPERLGFYIHAFTFGCSAVVYALLHSKPGDILYSRDYATLAFLCLFGFHPVAEIHDYRSRRPKKLIQFIINKARNVIVNSEGTKSLLLNHYTFNRDILVAPNGVNLKFFDIPETRDQARTTLKLPQDKIIVGYVGRFEVAGMAKGVQSLEEAVLRMEHRDKVKLLLVGGHDLNVPHSQVPLYLRAIDIAVLPLPQNQHAATTSPIKLFEYMAAGKAIVAADIPSFRAYLNEKNAIFYKQNELAKKLDRLVASPEIIQRIGQQALEDSKQYSWDIRARRILNFFVL